MIIGIPSVSSHALSCACNTWWKILWFSTSVQKRQELKTSTSSFRVCHKLNFGCYTFFNALFCIPLTLSVLVWWGGGCFWAALIQHVASQHSPLIFIVLRGRNMTDTRQLNPGFRTRTSQFALLPVWEWEDSSALNKSSRPSYCCHENKSRCCSSANFE